MSDKNDTGNGKGNGSHSQPTGSTEIFGQPNNDPISIYIGLWKRGFDLAVDQGIEVIRPEDEQMLAAFAEAAADCNSAAPFDPEKNVADRYAEERRQHDLAELERAEQEVAYANAAYRDRVRERADLGRRPVEPPPPILAWLVGILGLSIAMILALHDLVFAKLFPETGQAMVAATACGMVIAGLVVWVVLDGAKFEQPLALHVGLILVCLGFGAALLALRLGAAKGDKDLWVAYGFTGLEVVSMLLLEIYANGLRREWRRFFKEDMAFAVADEHVAAAEEHRTERLEYLSLCRDRVNRHDQAVAKRESLVRAAELNRKSAREAYTAGHRCGAAWNHGHLHGTALRRPTREEILEQLGARIPLVRRSIERDK